MDEATFALIRDALELVLDFNQDRSHPMFISERIPEKYYMLFINRVNEALADTSDEVRFHQLSSTLAVLKLVRACFIPPVQRHQQCAALVEWVESTNLDKKLLSKCNNDSVPLDRAWALVFELVCIGNLKEACRILDGIEESTESPLYVYIQALKELLHGYPTKNPAEKDFMSWRRMALGLQEMILEIDLSTLSDECKRIQCELIKMFKLCSGDPDYIAQSATNWVFGVVALGLYNDPAPSAIPGHYELVKNTGPEFNTERNGWNSACRSFLENRIFEAIAALNKLDPTCAIVTIEFLKEVDALDKYVRSPEYPMTRDAISLSYIQMLLTDERLFPYAFNFMINLNNPASRELAEKFLPQIVTKYPAFSEPALETAKKLGLPKLDAELSAIASQHFLHSHDYINALTFALRSHEMNKVYAIAVDMFRLLLVSPNAEHAFSKNTWEVISQRPSPEALAKLRGLECVLAPVGALCSLIGEIQTGDVVAAQNSVKALILAKTDALVEFYPLIVVLALRISSERSLNFSALLMRALDRFSESAELIQKRGNSHISEAMQAENRWSDLHGIRTVKHLRRKLAAQIGWL